MGVEEVGDTSAHPDPPGALEVISNSLRQDALFLAGLLERVRPGLPATVGPLLAPVEEYLAICGGLADEWAPEAALRETGGLPPLNRARIMALRIAARRLVVRTAGLLHQMLAAGHDTDGAEGAEVTDVRASLDLFLTRRCDAFEADCRARWIPVHDQVEHQFRIVLAASELAARFREPRAVRA